MTSSVIRTEGLTKVFQGDIHAVERLDLEVEEGELFGLLGPNGAGKTTTVGMLTTRVKPTAGSAYVAGIDVVAQPTPAKQVIGVVSQSNTLDRNLSVWENLYFHSRYFGMSHKAARQAAGELLERFRLSERASASVSALSGGMAQRLMVARSILHRPRILFLDEPTSGLDPQSRIALWEILEELHRAGHTVVLTTHYMEEADRLADRVAIMDHGKLLAVDSPRALKKDLGADTVVKVSSQSDPSALAGHFESFDGATEVHLLDGVVQITLKGTGSGILPQVIAFADRGNFVVTDLSITEPSLETVFINLTGKDLRE